MHGWNEESGTYFPLIICCVCGSVFVSFSSFHLTFLLFVCALNETKTYEIVRKSRDHLLRLSSGWMATRAGTTAESDMNFWWLTNDYCARAIHLDVKNYDLLLSSKSFGVTFALSLSCSVSRIALIHHEFICSWYRPML